MFIIAKIEAVGPASGYSLMMIMIKETFNDVWLSLMRLFALRTGTVIDVAHLYSHIQVTLQGTHIYGMQARTYTLSNRSDQRSQTSAENGAATWWIQRIRYCCGLLIANNPGHWSRIQKRIRNSRSPLTSNQFLLGQKGQKITRIRSLTE